MSRRDQRMTVELYDELKNAYRRPQHRRYLRNYNWTQDFSWADGLFESDLMPDLGDK